MTHTPTAVAAPPPPEDTQKPFVVELERLDESLSGYFRPHARLYLTTAIRTSRLWHALPGEETRTLLMLLTFLHPNGWCQPALGQIAAGMEVPEHKARARLERLAQIEWKGQPLVSQLRRDTGLDAWIPAPTLLEVREAPPPQTAPEMAVYRTAGREAVIAHSRVRYARPRAEVERDIAQRMGWEPPAVEGEAPEAAEERRQIYAQLQGVGLARDEAQGLLETFGVEAVRRQLDWLPYRHAKSPARFLMAAVEGDYERPPALRRQATPAQAEPGTLTLPGGVAGTLVPPESEPAQEQSPGEPGGDDGADLPPLTGDLADSTPADVDGTLPDTPSAPDV